MSSPKLSSSQLVDSQELISLDRIHRSSTFRIYDQCSVYHRILSFTHFRSARLCHVRFQLSHTPSLLFAWTDDCDIYRSQVREWSFGGNYERFIENCWVPRCFDQSRSVDGSSEFKIDLDDELVPQT